MARISKKTPDPVVESAFPITGDHAGLRDSFVARVVRDGECWRWTGRINRTVGQGYGFVYAGKRSGRTRRPSPRFASRRAGMVPSPDWLASTGSGASQSSGSDPATRGRT